MKKAKKEFKKTVNFLLVSFLTFGVLTTAGCGGRNLATPPGDNNPGNSPDFPFPDDPYQDVPQFPGDNDNDGYTDLPQEPIDMPEPPPAPPIPVNPGEHMILKAIGKTTSYVLPYVNIRGVYVNVDVTWQPVRGAHEYPLFKNILPQKHEATRNNAYKIVKADGLMSTRFIDGAQPPSFTGGNLLDKIKKGFNAVTLKPGMEYKYKVFAVDMDGNILGESDADMTVPLPPVAAPKQINVDERNTPKPLFTWQEGNDGIPPDGYFVSVYPPIQFGQQSFQPSGFGLAYWSTFRHGQTRVARYGSHSDNLAKYPGTLPFNINFPLKLENRYAVSITSVKTDTNDMRTAKAISKAWGGSEIFVTGNAPQPGNPNNPGAPVPNPTQPPTDNNDGEKTSTWKKVKGWFGF